MGNITPTFADQIKANGQSPGVPDGTFVPFPSLTTTVTGNTTPPVETEKVPLKVALIGTAPSSRMLAPFADTSWQIWSCSPGNMGVVPRVDAWFEIHNNLLWPEYISYGGPYVEWLKKQTFPIYMQDQATVPNALIFPKDKLVAEFGNYFFTSSFAWMMAKAISDGAVEIALFGIDMASRDEYILQRPGFGFFRYVAEQRGIKVWAPSESDIMQPPGLYGYSDSSPFGRKLSARKKEIQDRLAPLRQQQAQTQHTITYLEGALEDLDYIQSIWLGQGG